MPGTRRSLFLAFPFVRASRASDVPQSFCFEYAVTSTTSSHLESNRSTQALQIAEEEASWSSSARGEEYVRRRAGAALSCK